MEKNDYKKIVASCFCSMMLVSSAWAQESDLYAGGTGSKSDPYLIETEAQFDAVRENRGSYFKLMADLDFASYEKAQDEIQMTWKVYNQKFEEYLSRLQKKSETLEDTGKKRVNAIRQKISDECFEAGRKESGIYTLTVPTGGGKTLSSMRYALEHSERTNKERIIFVLPYTTIIEQNAKVIREVLGENCDLLEHHSNVTEDDKKDVVKEEIENMVKQNGHKYHVSYDLWEMCEGIHLYSLASIYSAFDSMLKIYEVLGVIGLLEM